MLRTISLLLIFSIPVCGQDPAALSDAAQDAVRANRPAEAEELWKKALKAAPNFYPALFNLGFFHYSRREFPEAIPDRKSVV